MTTHNTNRFFCLVIVQFIMFIAVKPINRFGKKRLPEEPNLAVMSGKAFKYSDCETSFAHIVF